VLHHNVAIDQVEALIIEQTQVGLVIDDVLDTGCVLREVTGTFNHQWSNVDPDDRCVIPFESEGATPDPTPEIERPVATTGFTEIHALQERHHGVDVADATFQELFEILATFELVLGKYRP